MHLISSLATALTRRRTCPNHVWLMSTMSLVCIFMFELCLGMTWIVYTMSKYVCGDIKMTLACPEVHGRTTLCPSRLCPQEHIPVCPCHAPRTWYGFGMSPSPWEDNIVSSECPQEHIPEYPDNVLHVLVMLLGHGMALVCPQVHGRTILCPQGRYVCILISCVMLRKGTSCWKTNKPWSMGF